jgi:hypothetical protein
MNHHVQRYLLHIACFGCDARFFVEPDPLPPCAHCGAHHWRIVGLWDLQTQAWPPTLPRDHEDERVCMRLA